ncbi:helix-turn-helix domain-containing protein [Rhodospirillum centenum]|uniref:Transcriptional regulator, Cro n=1 Tax=Rhodospirillum centenum (strain ATCC 51521 / SW) TaxID=414684 RepID=B6IXP8_RHOCS|nr:helix-turn-helix domain-containing protein [Rhodospirillum centenum]ACJ01072.1 transcriptional regulator, Cro [Rhodospirillum centenum SW]
MVEKGNRGRRGPRQSEEDAAVSAALGERVRARRGLLGMTQQELGRRVGLTFQQVQKYERGSNRVAVPTLIKLANALDTTPADLLEGLGATQVGSRDAALDRESLNLLSASRRIPAGVRHAMVGLAKALAEGRSVDAAFLDQESEPAGLSVDTDNGAGAAPGDGARRQGRRPRRRRGAIWDPADIERAARRS